MRFSAKWRLTFTVIILILSSLVFFTYLAPDLLQQEGLENNKKNKENFTGKDYIIVYKNNNTLHYYEKGREKREYPVSTGDPPELTPSGNFKIVTKIKGPGGAFGTRWMGLEVPEHEDGLKYGIHGTDEPQKIGQHASKGCIRMKNKDIEELFEKVAEGMIVKVK